MQNHDRERQEEEEEAAELWRLQETIATHKNNRRGGRESDSDYKTIWSPEQHPARRQQWERWEEPKAKRNWGHTNRTDGSPQPTNAARVQLPHTPTASLQPKIKKKTHRRTVWIGWIFSTVSTERHIINVLKHKLQRGRGRPELWGLIYLTLFLPECLKFHPVVSKLPLSRFVCLFFLLSPFNN